MPCDPEYQGKDDRRKNHQPRYGQVWFIPLQALCARRPEFRHKPVPSEYGSRKNRNYFKYPNQAGHSALYFVSCKSVKKI